MDAILSLKKMAGFGVLLISLTISTPVFPIDGVVADTGGVDITDLTLPHDADTTINQGYFSYKVSDNLEGLGDSWHSADTRDGLPFTFPHWVQIDFGTPRTVIKLNILAFSEFTDSNLRLKGFRFEGSNDGVNYTTIHENQYANRHEWQSFEFQNTTGYRYYRLYGLNNWTEESFLNVYPYANSQMIIEEWEMFEASTQSPQPTCFSTHATATVGGSSEPNMRFCFSQQGTLAQFEAPVGFAHIKGGEGYAVCSSSGVHGFEAGIAADGFGTPIITQPNGPNTLPLTITRTTTDASFQLQQTFAANAAQHEIVVTMNLKNVSAVAQDNVRLSRYVDNGVGVEKYGATPDSVWGHQSYGLMLTAMTFGTPHTTAVEALADWNPPAGTAKGCDAAGQATPTAAGDFVERVTYNLGTLKPGKSKTVKTLYRRF